MLKNEVFLLKNKIKELSLSINQLKVKEKVKFPELHNLINERTRSGSEEYLLKKFNTIYNGI